MKQMNTPPEKLRINSKSIARIAAIQVIYQYYDKKSDINSLLMNIVDFYKDADINDNFNVSANTEIRPSYGYLSDLVKYTHQSLQENNDVIEKFLVSGKKLEEMSKLLLSIVQVGITELRFFPEVSRKVIIKEYTDIAADMLSVNEAGFVNSLLDKQSKNHDE